MEACFPAVNWKTVVPIKDNKNGSAKEPFRLILEQIEICQEKIGESFSSDKIII